MLRAGVLTILIAFSITFAPLAFAQQSRYGTAAEAKAMLEKAVAAVKTNKANALDMFNKGEGGFLDRDLYPYCFNISDETEHRDPSQSCSGQRRADPQKPDWPGVWPRSMMRHRKERSAK